MWIMIYRFERRIHYLSSRFFMSDLGSFSHHLHIYLHMFRDLVIQSFTCSVSPPCESHQGS